MKVFVRNKLIPAAKASVSVFDHGLLYGDGVFETLRSYDGVVFKVTDHLKRLKRSASLIELRLPYGPDELGSIIYKTLRANGLKNGYIRLSVTRGKGPIGLDTSRCRQPILIVIAKRLLPNPASLYDRGVRVIIARARRNLRDAINPEIKSLNFLNNVIAKTEARKRKAFEAIMLNYRGYIAEGTVSNVFMVSNGVLITPSFASGILDGITRKTVLKVAHRNGIRTVEKRIRPTELYSADEVFLTNTSLEVMPVRQVESVHYRKGDVTGVLISGYKEEVKREINRYRKRSA